MSLEVAFGGLPLAAEGGEFPRPKKERRRAKQGDAVVHWVKQAATAAAGSRASADPAGVQLRSLDQVELVGRHPGRHSIRVNLPAASFQAVNYSPNLLCRSDPGEIFTVGVRPGPGSGGRAGVGPKCSGRIGRRWWRWRGHLHPYRGASARHSPPRCAFSTPQHPFATVAGPDEVQPVRRRGRPGGTPWLAGQQGGEGVD